MIKFCCLLILFLESLFCFSVERNVQADSVIVLLEKGDRFFEKERFPKALEQYQHASLYSNELSVQKRIAATLFQMSNYSDAIPLLKKIVDSGDTIDVFIQYYLAQSYHRSGEFALAQQMYERCILYAEENGIRSGLANLRKQQKQCLFWKELAQNQLDVNMSRLSVNSNYSDFGLQLTADMQTLFFTSTRKPSTYILGVDASEDVYFSKLFGATWSDPLPVTALNSDLNVSVAGLDSENEILYLSDVNNNGDLRQFYLGTDSVNLASIADLNTTEYNEVAITFDHKRGICFFVSNRVDKTNFGGFDIFSAELIDGKRYANVKNLGTTINSKFDDKSVFWNADEETLYFCSDREESIGGFDVFYSKRNAQGTFQEAKNIGLPINTPHDDISFCKVGNNGWYASSNGKQKFDLYEIDFSVSDYNPLWDTRILTGVEKINSYNLVDHVFFDAQKSDIDPNNKSVLNLLSVLQKTSGAKIRLTGHADWTGVTRYNDRYSVWRATNLAEFLVYNGVNPTMLNLSFMSGYLPVTDTVFETVENLESAMALNRSVLIHVEKQGEPFIEVRHIDGLLPFRDSLQQKYGVMVYVSDMPLHKYAKDSLLVESYSSIDSLYFYHSVYCTSISEAEKQLLLLNVKYPNSYIFSLDAKSFDFDNVHNSTIVNRK